MVKTKFAAHGYGGFFSTAILDNKYRDGTTDFLILISVTFT